VAVIDIGINPEWSTSMCIPKKEVRFRDEGAVFAALQRAVRSALDGSDPFRYRPTETTPAAAPTVWPQLALHDAPATLAGPKPTVTRRRHFSGRSVRQDWLLVAEGPHGLVLVDQHAAHEARPLQQAARTPSYWAGASQRADPEAVDIEPALSRARPSRELANLGLEYEEFGRAACASPRFRSSCPRVGDRGIQENTRRARRESRRMERSKGCRRTRLSLRGEVRHVLESRSSVACLPTSSQRRNRSRAARRPTRLLVEWQELTRHFRRNY